MLSLQEIQITHLAAGEGVGQAQLGLAGVQLLQLLDEEGEVGTQAAHELRRQLVAHAGELALLLEHAAQLAVVHAQLVLGLLWVRLLAGLLMLAELSSGAGAAA